MKKILSSLLVTSLIVGNILPVHALSITDNMVTSLVGESIGSNENQIKYPSGSEFEKIKSIVDTYLIKKKDRYYDDQWKTKPNYTPIIEKELKFLILSTYQGHTDFYEKLFPSTGYYYGSSDNKTSVNDILQRVPRAQHMDISSLLGGGSSVSDKFLDASFGVDFSEQGRSADFLSALESKIKEMRYEKCQNLSYNNQKCWSYDKKSDGLLNVFLPTQEELEKEELYLNRESRKISDYHDSFAYEIRKTPFSGDMKNDPVIEFKTETFSGSNKWNIIKTSQGKTLDERYIQDVQMTTGKNGSPGITIFLNNEGKQIYSELIPSKGDQKVMLFIRNEGVISMDPNLVNSSTENTKEASENIVMYDINTSIDQARKIVQDIKTEQEKLQDITYTLEYKEKSYTYESALKEVESKENKAEKKDYKKLMNGAKAENIPEIFQKIPNDSVSLYIKNPKNLLSILDQPSSGLQLSGIDSSKKIKEYMSKWLEIDDFSQIQKNLKHESAIILTNLDPTTPEVTFIISEKDRDALSGDGKTSIVKQQGGYIYVSNSQTAIETISGLKSSDSLAESDDFHYVWWKKSEKIQDAFAFVGDKFFEKITTLDTFIKHYRKIQDYKHLTSLQELAWAYKKAYNRDAKDFNEIITLISKSGEVGTNADVLKDYSIQNGIVTHKNIGTLNQTKTIGDANYDLGTITRKELDDYKYSILKYRDIWRASLDPMGIIINQYKDGVSIDFFMTPIPEFPDDGVNKVFKNFQDITKDHLDFIRDANVRSGMASAVFGVDTKKLKEKIDKPEGEIEKMLAMGYKESQQEVFGKDKNVDILSMLGGEFAFGIGSVDEDIMEFDAEKADAFFAVQVNSPEQGEELMKLVRDQMLQSVENGHGILGYYGLGGISTQLTKMLAKPSIEEYRGSKIYYVDDIAVPFVGTMGLSYGYAKNFVYFAINRNTIRHAIDTALDGDTEKANITLNSQTSTGVIFGTMLNGNKLNETVNAIAKRNSGILYIGAGELSSNVADMVSTLTAGYYQSYERNMLLGKKDMPFQEKIGVVELTGKDGNIFLKILPEEAHFSSGSIATQWNEFAPKIDTSYKTGSGVDLLKFLEKDDTFVSELAVFAFVSIFDNTEHTNVLFHNTLFTLNLGKDEVGFELRIFDGEKQEKNILGKLFQSNTTTIMVGIAVLILLLMGGGFIVMRNRGKKMIEITNSSSSITDPLVLVTEANKNVVEPQSNIVLPQESDSQIRP